MANLYKIIVFTPTSHADIVRQAMGDAGAGIAGNYTYCSFSSKGIGRSKPNDNADPFYGQKGELSSDEEEKIESFAEKEKMKEVISAIKKVHPHDEVVIEIYPILTAKDFE